jgi:hypothetical protein
MAPEDAQFFDKAEQDLLDLRRSATRSEAVIFGRQGLSVDFHSAWRQHCVLTLLIQVVERAGIPLPDADPLGPALEELRRFCEETHNPFYEPELITRGPQATLIPAMIADVLYAAASYCTHLKREVRRAYVTDECGSEGRPTKRPAGLLPTGKDRGTPTLAAHRRRLIRAWLVERDLSMKIVAARTDISVDAIRGMIRGDRTRYAEKTLRKLLKFLGITPEQWNGPPD